MSALLDPASYTPHIDTDFVVTLLDGSPRTFRLKFVQCTIDEPWQLAFSLQFSSPGPLLEQHIYPVSHPALGTFELFLVPVRARQRELLYEAVFNLLREPAAP